MTYPNARSPPSPEPHPPTPTSQSNHLPSLMREQFTLTTLHAAMESPAKKSWLKENLREMHVDADGVERIITR